MSLEIKVYDTVSTFDTLAQAEQEVGKIITKWFNSNDDKPLDITISKIKNNSPPALNINVTDILSIKGTMA